MGDSDASAICDCGASVPLPLMWSEAPQGVSCRACGTEIFGPLVRRARLTPDRSDVTELLVTLTLGAIAALIAWLLTPGP